MKLTCGHCGEELKLIHGAIHECETAEDRESAIYATGYWNGIQKAKEKNETLDTRSYLIGRYDGLRELTDEEIDNIFGICALNTTVTLTTEQCYWIVDAILKKASEK